MTGVLTSSLIKPTNASCLGIAIRHDEVGTQQAIFDILQSGGHFTTASETGELFFSTSTQKKKLSFIFTIDDDSTVTCNFDSNYELLLTLKQELVLDHHDHWLDKAQAWIVTGKKEETEQALLPTLQEHVTTQQEADFPGDTTVSNRQITPPPIIIQGHTITRTSKGEIIIPDSLLTRNKQTLSTVNSASIKYAFEDTMGDIYLGKTTKETLDYMIGCFITIGDYILVQYTDTHPMYKLIAAGLHAHEMHTFCSWIQSRYKQDLRNVLVLADLLEEAFLLGNTEFLSPT